MSIQEHIYIHSGEKADLEETDNATITKQLLQANIYKFSSVSLSDCHIVASVRSPMHECIVCSNCNKTFENSAMLEKHECEKSEIVTVKENANENQEHEEKMRHEDDEMDCESVTTTKKVRSGISDEQRKVLKDHYKMNPRPKLEDLKKIAKTIGMKVRVVEVWFQIARARGRREERLKHSVLLSDCHSVASVHSPKHECIVCSNCNKTFENSAMLEEHECEKSDVVTVKENASEDQEHKEKMRHEDDEMDCESVTTTKKVQVRLVISNEQFKVLKDHYKMNPRPKREDLKKIAKTIGIKVRVVEVWFKNARARARKEERLNQVPHTPSQTSCNML